MEVSPIIPLTAALAEVINCCSGDQCLWEEGREGESGSHCSCSLYFRSLRKIPAARMTDGNHSGVAVWYLASRWTGSRGRQA